MATVEDRVWVAETSGCRVMKKRPPFHGNHGAVMTKQGIVAVEQWDKVGRQGAVITLDFVYRRFHMRRRITREKPYSSRYLVTLARRFAEEVAYGKK